jgi:putative transposase
VFLLLIVLLAIWHAMSHASKPRSAGYRVAPKKVRPRSRRKPKWIRDEIIRLKAITGLSCYKLADTFNRMYAASHNATVGKTWVAEVVRAHRYEIADLRRRFKRSVPHPQRRNAIRVICHAHAARTGLSVPNSHRHGPGPL